MAKKKNELRTTKPNSIAEARGVMSKAFLDILDISMQLVTLDYLDNPDNLDYDFYVKDYSEHMNLKDSDSAFRKMHMAVHDTMKADTLLSIVEDGAEIDYFVFQEVRYIQQEGRVHVVFSRKFKEKLLELLKLRGKKIYYCLPDTLQMSSEYSKKMYPILLERVHKKEDDRMKLSAAGSLHGQEFDRIDPIDEFRGLLSIPKSYKFSHIKDTCSLIVNEICTYTQYQAEVFYNEGPKKGRYPKVTHICWRMQKKETVAEPREKSAEELELEALLRVFCEKHKIDLSDNEIAIILGDATKYEVDINGLQARLDCLVDREGKLKEIGNIVGFLRTLMRKYSDPKGHQQSHKEKFGFDGREYDFDELERMLLDY